MERKLAKRPQAAVRRQPENRRRQIGDMVWHNTKIGAFLVPESALASMHSYHQIPVERLNEIAKLTNKEANFKEKTGYVYLLFRLRSL